MKERQPITAVLRNGGFSGKMKFSFSNQHCIDPLILGLNDVKGLTFLVNN
jgi:hypothetical protein